VVTRKLTWGEDRVSYYDSSGNLRSVLTNVTDVVSQDAFSCISAGRSAFRVDDLLELRSLLDRHKRSSKGREICKVNIAAFVRRMLPQSCLGERLMDDLTPMESNDKPEVSLRRTKGAGILCLTWVVYEA
jgi:hypothetical protein